MAIINNKTWGAITPDTLAKLGPNHKNLLARRARYAFNKNSELQETISCMLATGKHIRIDDGSSYVR